MLYLLSVIDDRAGCAPRGGDAAGSAAPREVSALGVLSEGLVADGHWVFGGGLGVPGNAAVIDSRGAGAVVTDGPLVESKECLGGLWIIGAPDLDVALRLAAEGSKSCNRKVEVRPFPSG